MASYQLFPTIRPLPKSHTNQLKRPPSQDLQMNLKHKLAKAKDELITVRTVKGFQTPIPEQISEHIVEHSAETVPSPSEVASVSSSIQFTTSGAKETKAAKEPKEAKEMRGQSKESPVKEKARLGDAGDRRCHSPEESIMDLDSVLNFRDSTVSPSHQGPIRTATRLARFFPELSSHFSVASPTADHNTKQMGLTVFERELEERVQNLYRPSKPAAVYPEEPEPDVTRSSSDSNEGDATSSCYSGRTSLTSLEIGTEFESESGSPHERPFSDTYSIFTPLTTTVPSITLNIPNTSRELVEEISFDPRNKPLPLLKPDVYDPHAPNLQVGSSVSETSPYHRSQLPHLPRRDSLVRPLMSVSPNHIEGGESSQTLRVDRQPGRVLHGSQHSQHSGPQSRGDDRRKDELQLHGLRGQHTSQLQATEDSEDTLSEWTELTELTELAKDIPMKAMAILEGPLHTNGPHGDLVASRPAPLPPTKSAVKESSKTKRNSKEKNPLSILKSDRSSTKDAARKTAEKEKGRQDKEPWEETLLISKAKRSSTNSDESKNEPKKPKKKKSFLASFRKSSPTRVNARSECRESDITEDAQGESESHQAQQSVDLATAALLERVVEHFRSGSPAGPPTRQSEDQAALRNKMRQSWAFASTAQASSLQSTDHIYELPAEPLSPLPVSVPAIPAIPAKYLKPIALPVDLPVDVTLSIMQRIDSLDDLFNFVLVNKKIYNTFKRHELPLIKSALFKMSPPAWELREMSPPWEKEWQPFVDPDAPVPSYTPTSYLQRYAHDIYTLAKLKVLVLSRCAPFLRRETIRGLSGADDERAEQVDDAFWRVWTFCRIFGSGKGRENDIAGQMDWLRGGSQANSHSSSASTMTQPFGINNVLFEPPEGFGRGNLFGLSQDQMYDMVEIWTCMGVLLQPLHGNCAEAREVGIFDGLDIPEEEAVLEGTMLEEWTAYILTLGLDAVLTLSFMSPADTPSTTFLKAQSIGLTKWELAETEASRFSFLKDAVSRAYEHPEGQCSPSKSNSAEKSSKAVPENRQRQAAFAHELRHRRANGLEKPQEENPQEGSSFAAERPMSKYSAILRNLEGGEDQSDIPPVPALPALPALPPVPSLPPAQSPAPVQSAPPKPPVPVLVVEPTVIDTCTSDVIGTFSSYMTDTNTLHLTDICPSEYTDSSTLRLTNLWPSNLHDDLPDDRTDTSTLRLTEICPSDCMAPPRHTPTPMAFGSTYAPRSPLPSQFHPRSAPAAFVPPAPIPHILDPVDRAIDMIVNGLGFAPEDAKWALKITDTGEGINVTAAVHLLQKQKKKNERSLFGRRDSLLSSVMKRQKSHPTGWRWA